MPTLSNKQVNARAADLLESVAFAFLIPRAWARGTMARDGAGNDVSVQDPKASCFCSLGAIQAAGQDLGAGHDVRSRAKEALTRVIESNKRLIMTDIAAFNDSSREKYRVVEAFYEAAETLRA